MALSCTIRNVSVQVLTVLPFPTWNDPLETRSVLKLTIVDYTGLAQYWRGDPIVLSDGGTILYSGYVQSDSPSKQLPYALDTTILHAITTMDHQYGYDKRTNNVAYTNWYAGDIALDLAQRIGASEGVTVPGALHRDNTQASFAQGNLNGTTATSLNDLELAKAGTDFSLIETATADFATGTLTNMVATGNTLTPTTVNALKLQSTLSFAYGTEFAQSQQTASGTVSGTVSGTASGPINTNVSFIPGGSIFISGGNPGETANFSGNFTILNPSGSASLPVSAPFSTSSSLSVNQQYQPKTKSRVKVDATHYVAVTVDKAVADNRVDAKIWTGSYTVGANDTLNYDIWISSSSPSQEGGVDLFFSDGTQMTEYLGTLGSNTDVGVWDQNLVSASPIQDLSDHAKDCWYTRNLNLSILVGKTITSVSVFNASNIAGTFDLYIKNCYLGSHSGSPFFGTAATAPAVNPPTLSSIGAYVTSATIVTVTPVYLPVASNRVSPAHSIDSVKLVKSSLISWSASNPVTGPGVIAGSVGAATVAGNEAIFVSYDAVTWLPCGNNLPLPGLPAGANVAGMSLYLMEGFTGGQDPTALPSLLDLTVTINSAPNATTTDITSAYGSTTAWNTGTYEGLAPDAEGDLILGKTSYSWANTGNMTYVPGNTSASNPTQSVSGGAYIITTAGSSGTAWSTSRFNFISAAQDFTAEADFTLNGSSPTQNEIGFLYRQTYWGSPNNSFAYYIRIMQNSSGSAGGTSVTLGYGTNNPPSTLGAGPYTASGPFLPIVKVAETISNSTTYHLKLVVGGNRHTVYWNGGTTPIIDVLDNTYTAAGNIGLRTYVANSSGCTAKVANFTITNTFAGLWTSPSLNLNSLGTCGQTQVSWSEVNLTGSTQSTAMVLASLDGGTTWKQCTNGSITPTAAIPGLTVGTSVTGKSLTLQMVLSSTGFLAAPIIEGLYVRVCGAYPTVSGTRDTAPLGNDTSITRTVGSGWGTSFDGQAWAQVGTGTTAVGSTVETIANTTGDVHMVLGSTTWTDEDGTCRFKLSAATITAGMELRYTDTNNYYRLSVSTTAITITKKSSGFGSTLATSVVALTTNTLYRLRFRVVGNNLATLSGRVWADGTLEPTTWNVTALG